MSTIDSGIKYTILDHVSDLVSNFMYYDRKGCEDLKIGDIEKAVKAGYVTADEIVTEFRKHVERRIKEYQE